MRKLLPLLMIIALLLSCSDDDDNSNGQYCWEAKIPTGDTEMPYTYYYEKSMTEQQIKSLYPNSQYSKVDCDLLFTPEAKANSKCWYIRVTGEPNNILEVVYYKDKTANEISEIIKALNTKYSEMLSYTIHIQYYEINPTQVKNKYLNQ